MNIQLKDKTVLVTGSTEGIGFAIARKMAESRAKVILNGRNLEKVDRGVSLLERDTGATVRGVVADLTTPEGAQVLFETVPEVDVLVNNVGIFEQVPFAEITDEKWDRMIQTNVMSGVRLSRFYFPKMLEKKKGRVIFISSEVAIQSPPDMIHYGLSKSAQLALSRGLAELTAGTGVTVNTVMPGPTRTEGVEAFVGEMAKQQGLTLEEMEAKFFEDYRPSSLLRRFIQPEEVAATVVFLASDLAAATNGAAIRVEGGVLRTIA